MILQNPYFRKGTFEDDGDIEVITLDEYDNFHYTFYSAIDP